MYAFTLEQPKTLADAKTLASAGAQALAGGQTLIASMKQRLMRPENLVDLGGVAELRGVKVDGQTLVVGAMTCHQDVANHADVRKLIPGLADLANGIGDRQVRARGTMGGSVANNDPAACYPSAVLGLGATVVTDRRQIAADDFFQGLYTTALEPGELITAIRFPIPTKAAYAKFRQPASRFALVGVFVAQTAGGVRVAVTGTGNGVFRHAGLEAALGKSFTPDAVKDVAIDASDISSDLHASAAYRAHLIKVQTQAAVRQANG
ncbi:MAG: FAD binding domain-containing protein [Hydrogenophaga sp.]|jgi:carbon-monoxide dehydrogenase medium subunit|uniref:FAD binding domain-containing protein n=1 Tax=Hydrogenophaga sp. TaxID=1904254 RepID=UPI001DE6EF46|nr:xanthine dehydrogenase family protein subunit M [Hydrogenophaga sp.]MBW0172575.1 xanthine dehydrogenase family protein subunit M [Hydrogenophaga sp.]MBW0183737.1 xanthine dehydrogenase family protein subunit M [Hydrogenophaga sp.]